MAACAGALYFVDENVDGRRNRSKSDGEKAAYWAIAVIAVLLFAYLMYVLFVPWFNDLIVPDAKASYEKQLIAGSVFGLLAYMASRKNKNE